MVIHMRMLLFGALFALVSAAVVLAGSPHAYSEEEVRSVIKTGMTEAQLKAKFGDPLSQIQLANGDLFCTYSWPQEVGDFAGFTVILQNGKVLKWDPIRSDTFKYEERPAEQGKSAAGQSNQSQPKSNAEPLSFYEVSEKKIDGGRYIDNQRFPKLGYIAKAPCFQIKRLKHFSLGTETHSADGTKKPAVFIAMLSDDSKKFGEFTLANVGKRVLVAVGDKLISAPRIVAAIDTGLFTLPVETQKLLDEIKPDLEGMVVRGQQEKK